MSDGWKESAQDWIDAVGLQGDWGRRFVLDAPMIARIAGRGFGTAIDIGCGEGRFCRMMRDLGIVPIGVDPTVALIARARQLDPDGDYRVGRAEALDLPDATIDLAVSYLSLIDIPDLPAAIAETHRVLRPGGALLIANLQSFHTAGTPDRWLRLLGRSPLPRVDHYLDQRVSWEAWNGIRVQNWHRPLGTYMTLLLDAGFDLRHFAEPAPVGADAGRTALYRRAPYFLLMEWQKVR
ncbi:MAG: class I SAM-dependent methyltransferase [Pseudomonadota bacterium]